MSAGPTGRVPSTLGRQLRIRIGRRVAHPNLFGMAPEARPDGRARH